jgi:hypothetical protein
MCRYVPQYTPQKGVKKGLFWTPPAGSLVQTTGPAGSVVQTTGFGPPETPEISSILGVQHVCAHV